MPPFGKLLRNFVATCFSSSHANVSHISLISSVVQFLETQVEPKARPQSINSSMAHGMFRLFRYIFIDDILVRRALRCRRRTTRYFAGFVLSQNLSKMCCSCAENRSKPWSDAFLANLMPVTSRLISISFAARLRCWARAAAAHNSGNIIDKKSLRFSHDWNKIGLAWTYLHMFG